MMTDMLPTARSAVAIITSRSVNPARRLLIWSQIVPCTGPPSAPDDRRELVAVRVLERRQHVFADQRAPVVDDLARAVADRESAADATLAAREPRPLDALELDPLR